MCFSKFVPNVSFSIYFPCGLWENGTFTFGKESLLCPIIQRCSLTEINIWTQLYERLLMKRHKYIYSLYSHNVPTELWVTILSSPPIVLNTFVLNYSKNVNWLCVYSAFVFTTLIYSRNTSGSHCLVRGLCLAATGSVLLLHHSDHNRIRTDTFIFSGSLAFFRLLKKLYFSDLSVWISLFYPDTQKNPPCFHKWFLFFEEE